MNFPFTVNQFMEVFEKYNIAIWPMQIFTYLLGITAIFLGTRKIRYSDRLISGILSLFWLRMGFIYHLMYFSPINKAAYAFGITFIIQGLLFFWTGVLKPNISFKLTLDRFSVVGGIFILYATFVYPAIGYLLGHHYPQSPVFGLAPCPTTIFTFGMLLWTDKRVPKYILIIPFLWSIIGFGAALSLGTRGDIGLLIEGLTGTSMILYRDGKRQ